MKIATWLTQAKTKVDALDAELIALKVFAPMGADRSWLVAHAEDEIMIDAVIEPADMMVEERQRGVPLAYIVGRKEFYGRKFEVDSGVLIPRPETEALINLVKSLDLPSRPTFLDVGTGSGCIALTLALEYAQSYVLGTDRSKRALEVARRNDKTLEGRVAFAQSDLLKDLEFDKHPDHFDVLVANLPYVNKEWDWLDLKSLAHEPEMALFAKGNNGLAMYQRLLKEIDYYGGPEGMWLDYLVLEADPCQQAQLIKMAKKAGFVHLKTEGYGLLFEDQWRYWWDYRTHEAIHKPKVVLERERMSRKISFCRDECEWLKNGEDNA